MNGSDSSATQCDHETGGTMEPVKEAFYLGEPTASKYRECLPYYPYPGYGLVQITWRENYEEWGIADNPEKALEPGMASRIAVEGMKEGTFTGMRLDDYFTEKGGADWISARRIINGLDCADMVWRKAEKWKRYLAGLSSKTIKTS